MSKNKNFFKLLILILVIGIVVTMVKWISNKNRYQVNDNKTKELYAYFNSEDLESCNGLFNYSDKVINYDSIDNKTKLCLAYKNSDIKKAEQLTVEKDKKGKKDKNEKLTCTFDNMIFRVNDDEKECSYTKINKDIINDTYNKIYGKDIEDIESFQLDNLHICYLKDESIYCGLSETFTYVLGSDIDIYRVIEKTVEKSSEIEIYDYFIKVTDEKCYSYYTTNQENSECTKKLTNKIKYNFMKKYGTLYKHTFHKNENGSYYWVSSEPIN